MSNLVLSTFQKASFRGVNFLFKDNIQTGGRKYKIFEYPDQNNRVTEDLGQLQRTYKMSATIADSSIGYKASRQKLIDALEQEGTGILVHPIDGVKTVFSLPYTLNENISHTGTAIFQLTFVETGVQLFPTKSPSNASNIFQELNSLITTINSNFANIWATSSNFIGNIQFSGDLIAASVDSFNNSGNLVTNEITAFNSFITQLNNLFDTRFSVVDDPETLSTNISDLFSTAGQLGSTNEDNLLIMSSFFNYNPIESVNQITVPTEQREQNRLILNQLINAQSLSYYYLFLSNIQFETEEQINEQHIIINNQFIFIIINNSYTDLLGNSSPILNTSTLSILENLRFNAHDSLNAQVSTSRKVVDISIKSNSLLPLTYSYYNDLDLFQTLFNLNNLRSSTNLTGDFKVLTDEN